MKKKIFSGFWQSTAGIILNNRVLIIIGLILTTYFFTTHWDKIRFTYTEANLLPDTHPENIKYRAFTEKFGEEGNLIVISVKDSTLFTIEKLNAWNNLSNSFKGHSDVSTVISFGDLQKLKKDKDSRQFYIEPFIKDSISTPKSYIFFISLENLMRISGSIPFLLFPLIASPESFKRILLYFICQVEVELTKQI